MINALKLKLEKLEITFLFNHPYKRILSKNSIIAGEKRIDYGMLVNCGGLYADKIAKDFGFSQNYTLAPFKGLYLEFKDSERLVTRNIYPVPNIKNPFLGIHITVKVDGKIKIGPTAAPCFRERTMKD